jgi:hypothetical protein
MPAGPKSASCYSKTTYTWPRLTFLAPTTLENCNNLDPRWAVHLDTTAKGTLFEKLPSDPDNLAIRNSWITQSAPGPLALDRGGTARNRRECPVPPNVCAG